MPKSCKEDTLPSIIRQQTSIDTQILLRQTQIEYTVASVEKRIPEVGAPGNCAVMRDVNVPPILAQTSINASHNHFLACEEAVEYKTSKCKQRGSRSPVGYTNLRHLIFEHPAYRRWKPLRRYIVLELLSRVAWDVGEYEWNGKTYKFHKGDLYFSIRKLCKELKVSRKALRLTIGECVRERIWAHVYEHLGAQPPTHVRFLYSEIYEEARKYLGPAFKDEGAHLGAHLGAHKRIKSELIINTKTPKPPLPEDARIADDPALPLARRLVVFLFSSLRKVNEKIREPKGDTWERQLLELFHDKSLNLTIEEAEEVCDFIVYSHQYPSDGFSWSKPITNAAKFVKHFSTMYGQMQTAKKRPQKNTPKFRSSTETKIISEQQQNLVRFEYNRATKLVEQITVDPLQVKTAELMAVADNKNGPGKWIKFNAFGAEIFDYGKTTNLGQNISENIEIITQKMKEWGWL